MGIFVIPYIIVFVSFVLLWFFGLIMVLNKQK